MREDLGFVFAPVMTSSPAEKAELVQKLYVIEGLNCGPLSRDEALEGLKSRGRRVGSV